MSIRLIKPTPELPDDTPIELVRLPSRLANALAVSDLKTVGDVRDASDASLLAYQNFGAKSLDHVRKTLGVSSNAKATPRQRA